MICLLSPYVQSPLPVREGPGLQAYEGEPFKLQTYIFLLPLPPPLVLFPSFLPPLTS